MGPFMEKARITGPGAGVYKYDILTALTMWGLRGSPSEQVTVLRLIAMVTARYNWQRDEVSIGHRDLSRLWGVTERTVKREIKRLIALDLLAVQRPGVRGRVASYRLVPHTVVSLSAPHWDNVGPDFAQRFTERAAEAAQKKAAQSDASKVLQVDFQRRAASPQTEAAVGQDPSADPSEAGDPWSRLRGHLRTTSPEVFNAWFSGLSLADVTDDMVTIRAPSAFVLRYIETHFRDMLAAATAQAFGPDRRLVLTAVHSTA